MRYTLRMMGVVSLALLAVACVTKTQYNQAILKVESAWKEINDQTLASEGRRVFNATKQQGFMAAQLTASRLGMVVEKQSYETGFLFVTASAPVPLTMAEWTMVQKADTPDLRDVIAEEFGLLRWWVTLDPSSKDVLANVFVNEKGEGIEVTLGLRLRNKGAASARKRRLQPPPTAVRMGLSKFWATFEQELSSIVKKYAPSEPETVAARSVQKPVIPPKAAVASAVQIATNPDAIAVIIGNKNYGDRIPPVDFAHNDAEAMKRFFVAALGLSDNNVIDLRDATLVEMEAVLGNARTHKAKLWRWVRPHESDVFVFYSGHGVPGLKDGREYLLPVDGDPDAPEIYGYPAEQLYGNLANLEARSVTVFLDTCFSGESPGGTLVREASGIRVVPKEVSPVSFTVMSAAHMDQVASWDKQAQHGLFTKHLLDALYGAADDRRYGNADNRITLNELKGYLDREMTYSARRQYGREQRAMVVGDPEEVIVILER
jgi:hypothetical protein